MIYNDTRCALGEGPLWHPERKSLIWFDILNSKMFEQSGNRGRSWDFDEHVSAAGWIDKTSVLMASETGLFRFDLETGAQEHVVPLEADNPLTRSNDGRADPYGGFWIGTMGKQAETGLGAIYRYYRGELRSLFAPISISNAICFAPDGRRAYFADTRQRQIMTVPLDAEGWPSADPQVFVDLRQENLPPDGAVVDASGHLWNAQYGAGRVACYGPDGRFVTAIGVTAQLTTCPAFGGDDLTTLFVTSAADGAAADDGFGGSTFAVATQTKGQAEHRVIL